MKGEPGNGEREVQRMKIKTEERREREATRVTEKSREIRQAGEIHYYLFMNVEYYDA